MKKKLLIFSFLCLFPFSAGWAEDKPGQSVLHDFLYSKNMEVRRMSYRTIIDNADVYRDLVLSELEKYSRNPKNTPDALIYIAAYLKDKRYIGPLVKLVSDKEYSENRCIYSCPIVFSLVIFACFTPHQVPEGLDTSMTAVSDLYSDIKRVKSISLTLKNASDYVTGPGIDKQIRFAQKLPDEALLKQAGPNNDNKLGRTAAAYLLEYKTIDSTYLDELYWLAISGFQDASTEYLTAIYWAIYRAETANKQGR